MSGFAGGVAELVLLFRRGDLLVWIHRLKSGDRFMATAGKADLEASGGCGFLPLTAVRPVQGLRRGWLAVCQGAVGRLAPALRQAGSRAGSK